MSNIGNISNLPKSIAPDKSSFEAPEKSEYPPIGPTASSPGPILLKQEAVAVKLVVKLNLSSDRSKKMAKKRIKYTAR